MNIRSRIGKLELACGQHRALHDLSDAELEARIAALVGLPKGAPITDEMLHQLIAETKANLSGAAQ